RRRLRLHPGRAGVWPGPRPHALPPAPRGTRGGPSRRREDRATGPGGRAGLRPVAAPPVRWEEGSVKALPRTLTLVGAVVTALAVWSCFVVVDVTEHALILRLGRVVRVIREPGLYFKGP